MSPALLFTLIGIGAIDSLNPTLFVAQLYLLTTPNPAPRVLSYIAGVVLVNVGGGILLLGGARTLLTDLLDALAGRPLRVIELVAGLAILAFGLWTRSSTGTALKTPRSLRPLHGFALGAAVMLNELTTAIPYVVAVERIAQAGMGIAGAAASLALYNLVFAAPLLAFLALYLALRERFAARIVRVSAAVQRWMPRVLKYGAIVVGCALVLDGGAFLVSGRGMLE